MRIEIRMGINSKIYLTAVFRKFMQMYMNEESKIAIFVISTP